MSPVRVLILGVLFYLLFKLLFGQKRGKKGPVDEEVSTSTLQDTLVEDPVCHTYVPKSQASSIKQDGQTYYFCSDECQHKFLSRKEQDQ